MTMRSILLGWPLCLAALLAGCPFEEPPVISDSETMGTVGEDTTEGITTTTMPTTTVGPATDTTSSLNR